MQVGVQFSLYPWSFIIKCVQKANAFSAGKSLLCSYIDSLPGR